MLDLQLFGGLFIGLIMFLNVLYCEKTPVKSTCSHFSVQIIAIKASLKCYFSHIISVVIPIHRAV